MPCITTLIPTSMLSFRRSSRFLTTLLLLLIVTACGTRVHDYEHCLETTNGAVTTTKLGVGWNWEGAWDETICVSLTDQNYPERGDADAAAEVIDNAITKDSLVIAGDVALVWQHNPATIVDTYKSKRNSFGNINDAVLFEVQNALRDGFRSAVATQSINDLLGPNRAAFADVVKEKVQTKVGTRAVIKTVYIRGIRLPQSIATAREQIIKQAADLQAAKNAEAIAVANANKEVAVARGQAEANRLRAQAYAVNPKVLDLEIAKEYAKLCGSAQTCVIGASPNSLLGVRN